MNRMAIGKLATAVFIASEAVFFGFLIAGYIYFRANIHGTEFTQAPLDPPRTLIFTICLLASSGTMWIAERQLNRRNAAAFRMWLGATILLGLTFIAGQAWEYIGLFSQTMTPARNLFGASFFTLTGFHGFHVLCGLAALSSLLIMNLQRDFGQRQITGVESVAMYWHFVDVVWIAIFSIVYLSIWL